MTNKKFMTIILWFRDIYAYVCPNRLGIITQSFYM